MSAMVIDSLDYRDIEQHYGPSHLLVVNIDQFKQAWLKCTTCDHALLIFVSDGSDKYPTVRA